MRWMHWAGFGLLACGSVDDTSGLFGRDGETRDARTSRGDAAPSNRQGDAGADMSTGSPMGRWRLRAKDGGAVSSEGGTEVFFDSATPQVDGGAEGTGGVPGSGGFVGTGGGGSGGSLQCGSLKTCGGECVLPMPEHGCGRPTCEPCDPPPNSTAYCNPNGLCYFECDDGFVKSGAVCVPDGSGGTSGSGGTGGSSTGGSSGSGGSGGCSDGECGDHAYCSEFGDCVQCDVGSMNCDGFAVTKCESYMSKEHCGSCSNECPGLEECGTIDGVTWSCSLPESCRYIGVYDCDDEVGCETVASVENCGGCGIECAPGERCAATAESNNKKVCVPEG